MAQRFNKVNCNKLYVGSTTRTINSVAYPRFATVMSLSASTINALADGLTATKSELNILASVTATVSELNILDGVTATTSELNVAASLAGTLTAAELNKMDGITASAAELNLLDSMGATAAEINNACDASARRQELTATGAVTAGKQVVELNHATVAIAATIANSNAHQGLFIVKNTSATGTAAHTLTLTAGTFNGTNNVATLNAPKEALVVYFDSQGAGTVLENIGTVGLA